MVVKSLILGWVLWLVLIGLMILQVLQGAQCYCGKINNNEGIKKSWKKKCLDIVFLRVFGIW